LRQPSSRYTIHAWQQLTTEGFRYLKTVKVTAAVNLSLYQKLMSPTFTFRHRAGVRQYTSYYYLALSCVFNKQSPLAIMCHFFIATLG